MKATQEPGAVGEAAREVARLLHPHFVAGEDFALPPLALLSALAGGAVRPEMAEVLPMTRRLKAELPKMLAEHKQIVGALDKLRAAAIIRSAAKRKRGRSPVFLRSAEARAQSIFRIHSTSSLTSLSGTAGLGGIGTGPQTP